MSAAPVPATALRRFWTAVTVAPGEGGYAILLDGRPARTPGRTPLAVPTENLAKLIATEWASQGAQLDHRTMPLTRLANTALDGVAARMEDVRADLVRYAGSDLIVYRAAEPDALVAAQSTAWDSVHAWARDVLGAHFVLGQGIGFVEQPTEAIRRVADVVARTRSPFGLAALHVMTTLSGSVLTALMTAAGAITPKAAWAAAHADELYQEERWGSDAEASERRAVRQADFEAAAATIRALGAADADF